MQDVVSLSATCKALRYIAFVNIRVFTARQAMKFEDLLSNAELGDDPTYSIKAPGGYTESVSYWAYHPPPP